MIPPSPASVYILWWFIGNLVFIVLWDAIVIALRLPNATVSYSLYYYSTAYPLLYLLYGVVIGHLIVPLVVSLNGTGRP